ncbi:GTP-binding protein [Clostridium baratii]|uniref:CobW family GTP-binding protein n=1 Tax=Clostridium baratii TaxID=1561 RepID=UPI0030CAC500
MKTKIDIISGFLGAGKTTLINNLLKCEEYKKDIALIENEFGDIGIDGELISSTDMNIKEINSGCICCSVANDFYNGVIAIVEKYKPRRIIIEPSGVSKLSEIISICNKEELKDLLEIDSIITVVDGTKFNLYLTNFSEFYIDQIKNANSIFVSRKDILGDNLEKIINQIKSLNNKAKIISELEEINLKDKKYSDKESLDNNIQSNKIKHIKLNNKNKIISPRGNLKIANKGTINKTKATFQSIGINTERIFSEDELKYIIDKSKYFGEILRIKGFVNLSENKSIQFNFVPNELEVKVIDYKEKGKISIIGQDLNKKGLEKLFS